MNHQLVRVETLNVYRVAAVPQMRDNRRSPFAPEEVTIRRMSGRGVWHIKVTGYKLSNGQNTETGFTVDKDGTIEPNRRVDDIPVWLINLLTMDRAETEKP